MWLFRLWLKNEADKTYLPDPFGSRHVTAVYSVQVCFHGRDMKDMKKVLVCTMCSMYIICDLAGCIENDLPRGGKAAVWQ
jgi:hypothetical protein